MEHAELSSEEGHASSEVHNAEAQVPIPTEQSDQALAPRGVEDAPSFDEDIIPRGPEVDPAVTRRRKAIIRRLLLEFDLEDTIDNYRCLDPREYRYDESDFSLSSGAANSRVKQRLERLMGTDVVKLNDKKYMLKLEKNIQQEYEAALNKKETERMAIEQLRMRRLAVQGLSSDDYDEMGIPKNRKGRRRKKVTYDDQGSDSEDLKKITGKGRQPGHHAKYQDVKGQKPRELTGRPAAGEYQSRESSQNDAIGDTAQEVLGSKPTRSPREKYESPLVKEMKQEETVAGLYKIAQKIVLQ